MEGRDDGEHTAIIGVRLEEWCSDGEFRVAVVVPWEDVLPQQAANLAQNVILAG